MEVFLKTSIMFLGSSAGILLIYTFIYTVYIVKKTGKYSYFLWMLLPIIPLIHFFTIKKTKTIWVIFALMVMFYLFFSYHIAPSVPVSINKISFRIDDHEYMMSTEEDPDLSVKIKWEIYKRDLLRNLGILLNDAGYKGDLNIFTDGSVIIIQNYPLDTVLEIVKKR